MKFRILSVLLLALATASVVGCRTAQQTDPGTSTGLPYRPPGNPTLVDVPTTYKVYPTPKALNQ